MYYRKHIRLKKYDYRQNGYYFITICTTQSFPLLTLYKDMVKQELLNLEDRFIGLKLDFNEIMPTHIHFILYFQNVRVTLFRIIQAFKSITTLKAKQKAKQALQLQRLWQPNYYERVIRNESALNKIREYIMNNPEKERYDWNKLDTVL